MNTRKIFGYGFIAVILALAFTALSLTACDNGNTPSGSGGGGGGAAKDQTATISNLFNEGVSATVEGKLTDAQWSGVAAKVENALNGAYTAATNPQKGRLCEPFALNDVVIIVEKTTAYSIYKTAAGNTTTLWVSPDGLDSLQPKVLLEAVTAMTAGEEANT